MKASHIRIISSLAVILWLVIYVFNTKKKDAEKMSYHKGQYGYALEKLQRNYGTIELTSGTSKLVIVPALQGRVMTSTASGYKGFSFGWINYNLIGADSLSPKFNAFGGEERFWIGPEGGQFSYYFDPGKRMVMENWRVPGAIDTMSWSVIEATKVSATVQKSFRLTNYSGNQFEMEVTRRVNIIQPDEIPNLLSIELSDAVKAVAYESVNQIKNIGETAWNEQTGMPSIWMLSMYQPSEEATIIVPYKKDGEGPVVKDDYFGEIPPGRFKVGDGVILLKADGKFRSKIGVSPSRAFPLLGSYDAVNHCLTVLFSEIDSTSTEYVNSSWEAFQQEPFKGDVINAYNDGPLSDGGQLGPFYELETSSSSARLQPGETKTHIQRTFHFEGSEKELSRICQKLFGVSIAEIKSEL